jgi:hypothetical protein
MTQYEVWDISELPKYVEVDRRETESNVMSLYMLLAAAMADSRRSTTTGYTESPGPDLRRRFDDPKKLKGPRRSGRSSHSDCTRRV